MPIPLYHLYDRLFYEVHLGVQITILEFNTQPNPGDEVGYIFSLVSKMRPNLFQNKHGSQMYKATGITLNFLHRHKHPYILYILF